MGHNIKVTFQIHRRWLVRSFMTVTDRPEKWKAKKTPIFRNCCSFSNCKKMIAVMKILHHFKCTMTNIFLECTWQREFQSPFWFLTQLLNVYQVEGFKSGPYIHLNSKALLVFIVWCLHVHLISQHFMLVLINHPIQSRCAIQ